MKIDSALVKSLREGKSWSQEHLASAAGLSLRTVQRIESEGMAAPETRLAIASALAVSVSRLMPRTEAAARHTAIHARHARWGWTGWALGGLCSAIAILAGAPSPDVAGGQLGLLGLALGLCAAAMGALNRRARAPQDKSD